MLNQTAQQIMEIAQIKADAYIPALIILWVSGVIIMPLVFWAFKTRNTNWGRFWGAWFFTSLLSGIVLIGVLLSPNFLVEILVKIKSFFL